MEMIVTSLNDLNSCFKKYTLQFVFQEKVSTSPTLVQQQQQHPQQQQHQQQQPQHQYQQQQQPMQQYQQQGPQQQGPQQQHQQLHLPISAQMLSTTQGLATIVPTLQHLGSGLRVIPGDRQLLVTHTTGNNESRPLIAMQSNTGSEPRPVALVVHSSAANDNRVTFVHSNLSNNDRPLALAVQSSSSDVRPVTFVHSGNESRPLVLATHSPALNVSSKFYFHFKIHLPSNSLQAHSTTSFYIRF